MFSYVILHYKNIDETIECLTRLKKIAKSDSNFIVVDNHTLNDSEIKLIKSFTSDTLLLDKNYGFAVANNKGVKYAKKKYNSQYYVVMNNDVFIDDNSFEDVVKESYNKYNFDMLGPSILSPSGESVNPFPVIKTKNELIAEINRCKKLINIYNNAFLYTLLKVYLNIKHLIKKPIVPNNGLTVMKNVALHGCCIIFSKKYLDRYKEPFYKETFLFHEEEFLYKRIIDDNLVSLYNPSLKVFHKEGSSIKKKTSSERISKLFREQERLKSLNLLLNIM